MPVILADVTVQAQPNKSDDLDVKKAGDLALATVHLYTNDLTPTPETVVGDFEEATFTGYVAKAVVAWTANDEELGGAVRTSITTVLTWVGPGDATGQTIVGYYVLSAGGGTPLIYSARLNAPFALENAADVLSLVPTFRLP